MRKQFGVTLKHLEHGSQRTENSKTEKHVGLYKSRASLFDRWEELSKEQQNKKKNCDTCQNKNKNREACQNKNKNYENASVKGISTHTV